MKKTIGRKLILTTLTVFLIIGVTFSTVALTKEEMVFTSDAVYMLEVNSNSVLYSSNADQKIYPASTTKLLTAMVILDNIDLSTEVTVGILPDMESQSTMKLVEGETMTVENYLWGILMVSANDACYVLAEEIAGGQAEFAGLMNEKAQEIGAVNSNFVTTSGMHDPNHYSTAEDLGLIMIEAMEYDKMVEMMETETYTIPATNKNKERELENTNALISAKEGDTVTVGGAAIPLKVDYPVVGKTGHVAESGYNLVNIAENDDLELLTVVIGAPDTMSRFTDTLNLLEYGMTNFKTILLEDPGKAVATVNIKGGSSPKIGGTSEEGVYATIFQELPDSFASYEVEVYEDLEAPIKKGQQVGVISTYANGSLMGEIPLVASMDVEKGGPWTLIGISDGAFILLCVLLVLIIILNIAGRKAKITVNPIKIIKNAISRKREKEKFEDEFYYDDYDDLY